MTSPPDADLISVVTLGTHVLDVLGRPVDAVPPGQASVLLEEIRMTAAGTAAGVAVDLARLGAAVATVGAVGTDTVGDLLTGLLRGHGVDTRALARLPRAQTSASMLPIRSNGERPALHVPGANAAVTLAELDLSPLAGARAVHLGGLDTMAGLDAADLQVLLTRVRRDGPLVTMDVQSGNQTARARRTRDLLPLVDVFLPNLDQAVGLTGCTDPAAAAAALLGDGAAAVVLTMGAEGSLYVSATETVHTPALRCDVRDTTGCGDAFTAGFVVATLRGLPVREALRRATAAATLVAGGLGSDAGLVDWAHLEEFLATAEPLVP